MADDTFIPTWGESSVFVLLTNGNEPDTTGKKKRWFALLLLVLMIVGATVGELPVTKEMFPDIKLDMFFFVSITTIIMAWTNLFPARKYTKYISWDILITIACAFAISKAMVNSGVADSVAKFIIGLSDDYGPHVLLAMVFIITNLFTELITNNAAAALAFPLALSISAQLGVSPTPFFVVICMAASASFSNYNPLKGRVDEMDFQALVKGEVVHSVAEIVLVNHDKLESGVLQQQLEEVSYKALPSALVDKVEIDVAKLRIGDTIKVKDLSLAQDKDVHLVTDPETTVVTVTESHIAIADDEDSEETE